MRTTTLPTKSNFQEALHLCAERFADGLMAVIQERFREDPEGFKNELFFDEAPSPKRRLPARKVKRLPAKGHLKLVSSRPMKLLPPASAHE